jgi:hypothetical protein
MTTRCILDKWSWQYASSWQATQQNPINSIQLGSQEKGKLFFVSGRTELLQICAQSAYPDS